MSNDRRRRVATLLLALSPVLPRIASAGPQEEFLVAVKRDDASGVRTWMLRGVDPNVRDAGEGPAIMVAARARSFRSLRALLDSPETQVDAPNGNDETALMLVAMFGDVALARLLVAKGAEVNRPGWTPLHYAAASGNIEMVRYLLGESAYIDAESPNRTTPLMMAARQKHRAIVELLLAEGADPTPRNEAGMTAADYLRKNGDNDAASAMQQKAREFDAKYRPAEGSR